MALVKNQLTGSEKQIEWAEKIREAVFSHITPDINWMLENKPKFLESTKRIIAFYEGQVSAKWWIDNYKKAVDFNGKIDIWYIENQHREISKEQKVPLIIFKRTFDEWKGC